MMEMFRRAHDHQGAAFVEIYQNCNVFNDGAFESDHRQGRSATTMLIPLRARRADPLRRRRARRASSLDAGGRARIVDVADVGEDAHPRARRGPRRARPGVHAVAARPRARTSRRRSACSAPSSGPSTARASTRQLAAAQDDRGPGDLAALLRSRRHLGGRLATPVGLLAPWRRFVGHSADERTPVVRGMPLTLRIFTEPQQGASYDDLLAVAREAEALGFDAFFRSDHYLKMGDVPGLPGPTDAWITLAGLARDTERIRLGTLVTAATFRSPGPARDLRRPGRRHVRAAGWSSGSAAGGTTRSTRPTASPSRRSPSGSSASRSSSPSSPACGRRRSARRSRSTAPTISCVDSPALPKPVQTPRPPVLIGGWGKTRTPRLAARFADEFNVPFPQLADVGPQVDAVRAACETAGATRPPCGGPRRWSCAAARTRMRAAGGRAPSAALPTSCGRTAQPAPWPRSSRRSARYADAGMERIYLQVLDLHDLDHLRLVATEVAPAVS